MNKKHLIIIVSAILMLTALLVVIHLSRDDVNAENAVTLSFERKQVTIPLSKLAVKEFTGTLINGKGEQMIDDYTGIELSKLMESKGVDLSEVKYAEVTAQDQYSVKIFINEIVDSGKIYIAVKKNGTTLQGLQNNTNGAQLIVFGDPDCKRCVSYLESIKLYSDED